MAGQTDVESQSFSRRLAELYRSATQRNGQQSSKANCKLSGYVFKAILWFCKKFFKYPVVPLFLIVLVLAHSIIHIFLAVFVYPPQIDLRLQAFQIPNHESSLHYDAFKTVASQSAASKNSLAASSFAGLLGRRKRSTGPSGGTSQPGNPYGCSGRTHSSTIGVYQYMELVFVAPKGTDPNVFTRERLQDIHAVEMRIMKDQEFRKYCIMRSGVCDPLNSVLTYFYPTVEGSKLVYDGRGDVLLDINTTLAEVIQNKMAYWYIDGSFNSKNLKSSFIRSQLRVAYPIEGYCSYADRHEEQVEKINEYFNSLVPYLKMASTKNIDVLYGGPTLVDGQVTEAVVHDATLAAISFVMIIILVFLSTGCSFTSTLAALITIVSCFPLAFFIYRIVFSIQAVGVLNVVSLFVIVGIGVDDVFVFINTFKQSGNMDSLPSLPHRLAYTITHAGKATFFTSLTTAVAFFANAAIDIPAVRQFGVFMGLVILLCYVQVLLLLPSFLYFWAKWFSRGEKFCATPVTWLGRLIVNRVREIRVFRNVGLSVRSTDNPPRTHTPGISLSAIEVDREGDGTGLEEEEEDDVNPLLPSIQYSDASVNGPLDGNLVKTTPFRDDDPSDDDDPPLSVTDTPSSQESLSGTSSTSDQLECGNSSNSKPLSSNKNKSASSTSILSLKALYYGIAFPVVYMRIAVMILFGLFVVAGAVCSGFLHSSGDLKLFSDDSNIQRLLDMVGNLTSVGDFDCATCSAYYKHKYGTYIVPTTPPTSHTHTPSAPPTTQSTTAHPTHGSTDTTTPPTTHPTTPPTTHRTTPTTAHTTVPATATNPPFNYTSKCSGSGYNKCLSTAAKRPDFGGNAVVFVVLGVSRFERNYSPTHVLPKNNKLGTVVYNKGFSQSLRYSRGHLFIYDKLVRAMCRICRNISNPANGLVQPNGAKCFPASFASYLANYQECAFLSQTSSSTALTVDPLIYVEAANSNSFSVKSVVMAFRSIVNPNGFNINNKEHYERWNKFLKQELDDLKRSPEVYGNSSAILEGAFHTSSYWVLLNLEVAAVEGAAIGIALSVGVCLATLIVLFGNWRILVSISVTIVGIFFTVLLFFKIFQWNIGAVEAVCLAVLVGNSLDYCIHLAQCYFSTNGEQLQTVDSFGAKGSLRKRKALSAITHISSSVLSSAATTLVATLPLLAAEIHPFKRFGEILVLNTAVAIVYTLVVCGSLLSFLGPKEKRYCCCKIG